MDHRGKQQLVRLNLDKARVGRFKQRLKQVKRVCAVFRQHIELKQRGLVLPGTADGKRPKPGVGAADLEQIGERPAGPPMNGVVDDLAVHLLPVAGAERERVSVGGWASFGLHRARLP